LILADIPQAHKATANEMPPIIDNNIQTRLPLTRAQTKMPTGTNVTNTINAVLERVLLKTTSLTMPS